ncbi:zinc finger protein 354B-like isoform X4 [Aricia agestis]|uniref:zinc finger protein 354B-like isoform X4 n=1 Tax=Aricia agestis TaxID=91739 RepID=UPI001C20A1F2|nr:zinc finger protein 354B-like isoform X4 [Aricia agestis]
MDNQPNVNDRCRTCMMKIFTEITAVNIFERNIQNISVAEILHSFTALTFDANDELPKVVCHLCYEKLYSFYQFVLHIENVDTKFQEELKDKDHSSFKSDEIMKKNFNFQVVPVEHTSIQEDEGSLGIKKEICEEENGALDTTIKFEIVQEYVCKICYKYFSNKGNYQRHIKKHSVSDLNNRISQAKHSNHNDSCLTGSIEIEVNPLEDNINSDNEADENDIKQGFQEKPAQHITDTSGKEGIVCKICNRCFRNKNSMSAHMRKHVVKGRVLSCPTCGKVFNKVHHLTRHQNFLHKDHDETSTHSAMKNLSTAATKNDFMCIICTRRFKSQHSMAAHMKIHVQMKTVRDSNENISKDDEKITNCKRKNVRDNYNGTEEAKVLCEICQKRFKSKNSLSAHMKIHVNKERVLACSKCGKVFPKVNNLKRHELSHEEKRKYKCGFCSESYLTEEILEQHLKQHGETKICSVCQKTFADMLALNTHVLKLHRCKLHLCSYCGKKFESRRQLHQHHQRHMGIKRFACSLCPKKFITNGELRAHASTHTGERLHKCKQCNAAFTNSSALAQHTFRHLGIKPYHCDVCPKTCDHCTESFRLKTELTHHITQHYAAKLQQTDMAAERTDVIQTNALNG